MNTEPVYSPAVQALINEDLAYLTAGADPQGCRPLGSEFADSVGFTADVFDGYLWVDGADCWMPMVVCKQPGQGHFSRLLKAVEAAGYRIRVPNPFEDMRAILRAKGFHPDADDPLTWSQSRPLTSSF